MHLSFIYWVLSMPVSIILLSILVVHHLRRVLVVVHLGNVRIIRLLVALRSHHLIDCIVIFRIFLVLLSFLVASLALVLGILLSIRMASVACNAHEVSAISWLVVSLKSGMLTHIIVFIKPFFTMLIVMGRSLLWRVFDSFVILMEIFCKFSISSPMILRKLAIHGRRLRFTCCKEMV